MLGGNSTDRPEGNTYYTPNIVLDMENRHFPTKHTLYDFLVFQWLVPIQITT